MSCFVYEWLCHALCMSDCAMLCVWMIAPCFVKNWSFNGSHFEQKWRLKTLNETPHRNVEQTGALLYPFLLLAKQHWLPCVEDDFLVHAGDLCVLASEIQCSVEKVLGDRRFFRFSDVLFLPIFQIADFLILSNFSNYFRPFLILPLFFELFEFFPVYNYALFIVLMIFFDDFWCFYDSLGFMIFYGFSFLLSSPNFMLVLSLPPPPPMFSTLYLPANFCQFFRAQVVLRTTPFLSRPIWTTLLSKVSSFLFIKHLRIGWNS